MVSFAPLRLYGLEKHSFVMSIYLVELLVAPLGLWASSKLLSLWGHMVGESLRCIFDVERLFPWGRPADWVCINPVSNMLNKLQGQPESYEKKYG
jgi:hypothetical protein